MSLTKQAVALKWEIQSEYGVDGDDLRGNGRDANLTAAKVAYITRGRALGIPVTVLASQHHRRVRRHHLPPSKRQNAGDFSGLCKTPQGHSQGLRRGTPMTALLPDVQYSVLALTDRLQAVSNALDEGAGPGQLVLLAGSSPVCTVPLAKPSATASGAVLTFNGTPLVAIAAGTGTITSAQLQDSNGVMMVSDLSIGIPGSTSDVIIANNNSTLISAGQSVSVLAIQITGNN
jgi:hypothetical protein